MNRPNPRDAKRPHDAKDAKDSRHGGVTGHGGLYDRHGPIPVPEAHESDTESAWALFEESVMRQDNPDTLPPPNFEETSLDGGKFESTDFEDPAFGATRAAPLKP